MTSLDPTREGTALNADARLAEIRQGVDNREFTDNVTISWLAAQLDEARKDSARYRFMAQRFAAADFNYPQYEDYTVLIIALNGRASVSADLDTTIDAAMAAAAWPSIEYVR